MGGKVIFDTSKDIFRTLRSTQWYRTQGFNEVAFGLVRSMSYREAAQMLNRVRREQEGTPSRTLAHTIETEGSRVQEAIDGKSQQILQDNGFTAEGKPIAEDSEYGIAPESASIPTAQVMGAIEEYNEGKDESARIDVDQVGKSYENSEETVNISLDDVGVKKQKETGRSPARERKDKREYVENTVGHVEHGGRRYIFNTSSIAAIIPLLVAFLLHNKLLGYYLHFFVDGARNLQGAILRGFSWFRSFSMILDWYHLQQKCKTELSLALRNSVLRNSVLEHILPLLWLGKMDAAIQALRDVPTDHLKPGKTADALIAYFERNRPYIPCYALRKKLGLRNSSNKGEKANDLAVANRQKHNGMSWSQEGSPALATITTLHLNNEEKNWIRHGRVEYKLVDHKAAA